MKILFQGDSITDAGRDRNDPHNLGAGYPKYTAELIKQAYPTMEFEFIDLGISGNRTENLVERLQPDFIDIQPDVVSILIGVNDTWHFYGSGIKCPHDYYESNYRKVLTELKEKTNAKIILLEQFLLSVPDKDHFRDDLDPKMQITRKLAREFADVYVPLDGLFAAASIKKAPTHWAADGVHPTAEGAKFIAEHYLNAFKEMI
jgi:Lysophospholipase L1 and related esterases